MSEHEASVSCSPQCAETDNIKNTDDINPETVQNTNTNISQVEEGSQSDSDLLKGLLTDDFCHVCEATLIHESQRVSHYEGKKHAQRVRMYLNNKAKMNKTSQDCGGLLRGLSAEKFCELCSMVFSSPTVAKSHYEGKVHAKNMRKTNPPPPGVPILEPTSPVALPSVNAVQNPISQEQSDTSGSADQEVDLDDPNKYCTLCSASFNNPLVAQQHYSGRKHQRNQARIEMLDQMGEQSEHVSSLTCPICCLVLSSIEMYQAHMQGNKHFTKEKKVMDLCKSQKKVYDSFQDELADYIQVQKARGLEPKAGPGTLGKASNVLDESTTEGPLKGEEMPPGQLMPCFPPPGFPRPHWPPQFQSQVQQFGFGVRGPVPHYRPGYMPQSRPPFIPGHLYKKGRSPESFSSSSFSGSCSYNSSSSDSSSSYDSRERRRRKRKMRKRGKSRRDQEDGSDTEKRGREGEPERAERKKRLKEDRRGSVEGDEDRNKKWKERRKRDRSSSEDEESRSKRRTSKKSRRHGDGLHAKRQKEEELLEKQEVVVQNKEAQGRMEEHVEERTETKDGKQKHKKEKKKGKEKMNQEDNRTEEERLWDETILGVF
ncbi:zinc finger matrin-type protein 1 [Siphateles boraxobius]|uniref:zinc finger matrin-type protein 1 n=1 Tax=Siphateles boraxobius TaxID=180520 RepID=UPI004063B8E4